MENICISTVEGYSFFIENENNFAMFKSGKPMHGTDISKELGVTRMAISQALKRSFRKIYNSLKKTNGYYDPFEIAVVMSQMFRVSIDSENEMTKFFNLFPANIKQEIKEHAKNHVNYCS